MNFNIIIYKFYFINYNLSIMKITMKITLFCNKCRNIKPNNKFIGFKIKEASKQFYTYNNCHNRMVK